MVDGYIEFFFLSRTTENVSSTPKHYTTILLYYITTLSMQFYLPHIGIVPSVLFTDIILIKYVDTCQTVSLLLALATTI